jgi:hypothetical protein
VVTSVSVTHVRATASVTGGPAKSDGSGLGVEKAFATAFFTVVVFVVAMTWWNLRLGFWAHF